MVSIDFKGSRTDTSILDRMRRMRAWGMRALEIIGKLRKQSFPPFVFFSGAVQEMFVFAIVSKLFRLSPRPHFYHPHLLYKGVEL